MSVSTSLKLLADNLQKGADAVLSEAEHDPTLFALVADVVAGSIARLEKAAEQLEQKKLGGGVYKKEITICFNAFIFLDLYKIYCYCRKKVVQYLLVLGFN